ncbi:MAG: hypothetical protein RBR97_14500 [Bacteroidales bacterium]|nr:hypothetical protein [Bacteroidales bacterium]
MKIRILGTESLGVRGLSCVVEVCNKKIVIDPGIALGYSRNGLLPHPVQIGVGEIIRSNIIKEMEDATDIVISHLHGDHIPLYNANPYQLSIDQIKKVPLDCKIWINDNYEQNEKKRRREAAIVFGFNKELNEAKGKVNEFISFLGPVPHGEETGSHGNVIMTMIADGDQTFLHGSDIQFFCRDTIDEIISYNPDIVLASGPPLYLTDRMKSKSDITWDNTLRLAKNVKTLILDHHLLRCEEGLEWIKKLEELSGNRVICAADFMNCKRHLLEAWRLKLYRDIPVPANWHRLYKENIVSSDEYMDIARKKYVWFEY